MTERWEYAAVTWTYTTELEGGDRIWRQHISTYRPGGETRKHEFWNSKQEEAVGPNLVEVFNELGAEGWELVTDTVSDSTVIPHDSGWDDVGTPTLRQFILKRRR